jgi:NADH-quinone oxidoreductase subunit L
MLAYSWLIPLFPILGFVVIGLLNKRLSVSLSGGIATLMVFLSFVVSAVIFFTVRQENFIPERIVIFDWISFGDLSIPFSFLIDRLSIIMLLVITGVGTLIHLYSMGYMHHEQDHSRYFSYLNLFVFFMLLLVMGSNYIVMFTGWEGVGLCSYLLIGFWFKNHEYNNAAKKAFIMNRIGDLGFLLGLFLIYINYGSFSFSQIFSHANSASSETITAITLLLFVGAMGKSAQIPLYTWLPDAMAGPTPVSALIHAATMVTAGIYMVIRSNVLYTLAPFTLEFVAIIGLATAFFAATIGLKQHDIKKVLAYSTVSQLGFMFVALGVGAYDTALFHVVTHAFFKALLFLGAGSVIHAMSGEQDIRMMGGLKKKLSITHLTFLAGTLAIAGIPPFAGFFSKDEILAKTWEHSPVMFVVLAISSLITAVYMFRLYFLVFHGEFRGTEHQRAHLHESPASMTLPLIVLAVLSTFGGFLGMPAIFHQPHYFADFLRPVTNITEGHGVSHEFEWALIITFVILLAIVAFAVHNYYVKSKNMPEKSEDEISGLPKLLANKYYIDEIYAAIITKPLDHLSAFSYTYIEKGLIDGIVNGTGKTLNGVSGTLRKVQNGHIGTYVFGMVIGIILLIALTLFF